MSERTLTLPAASAHTTDDAKKRLRARYKAEARFKAMGLGALVIACGFLVFFLTTIIRQATPAFFQNYLMLPITMEGNPVEADYDTLTSQSLQAVFGPGSDRMQRRAISALLSSGAPTLLRNAAGTHPERIGMQHTYALPLDDGADLYLKGQVSSIEKSDGRGDLTISTNGGQSELSVPGGFENVLKKLNASASETAPFLLGGKVPSVLVRSGETVFKLTSILSADRALAEPLLQLTNAKSGGLWQTIVIETPEADRKLNDRAIVLAEHLKERGLIEYKISREFFTSGASREAEIAGIWSAFIGSLLTLFVTLGVSFPLGVAAAIYLEEFAPKNRFTDLIEVNINNLAAVPSIIFGLLGLAVFLNMFGMPRSAPVVGGLVLALMTLPVIIIASRAALRSVPPSIKEAALGLGASHLQAVFHHVLPLSMPGILTGTILGLARALGETAPLLMIGMVAFVVDAPKGFTDAATLLPVQIFMWVDFPEVAFQQKTAAAILVLLAFLISMNCIAVVLRKHFERRW